MATILDERLGGKNNRGTKYRDPKTGRLASVPRCPPHHWIIDSANYGKCRKCGEERDFALIMRRAETLERMVRNNRGGKRGRKRKGA